MTAGFLAVEGMHALEGKISNVQKLFDAGVRMMSPVHFFDNDIGGSAHGIKQGGLTQLGTKALIEMERLSLTIDLSHCSEKTMDDVFNLHRKKILKNPIVISHGGVKGTCDNVRNVNDYQLQGIAETDGVMGVGYWKQAVGGNNAAATARAIRYTANVIGIDHVALGSDFDGMVKTHFDTAHLIMITEALKHENFTDREVRKIMGENTLRVLRHNLPN